MYVYRDFLSDQEAVDIVASCPKREDAANLLVLKTLEVGVYYSVIYSI